MLVVFEAGGLGVDVRQQPVSLGQLTLRTDGWDGGGSPAGNPVGTSRGDRAV